MVFSSLEFLFVFLPIFLLCYYLFPKRMQNLILLIGSMIFYIYGAYDKEQIGKSIASILLFLATIVLTFTCGRFIERQFQCADRAEQPDRHKRFAKAWLLIGLIFNIGWLVFFKYTNFFLENWNHISSGEPIPPLKLLMPIGISFYTFQTVSYLVDVYRKDIPAEKSLLRFSVVIAMFPHIISGPIFRYRTISPDLRERTVTLSQFDEGLRTMTIGLGYKVLLANQLGGLWSDLSAIGYESISTPLAWAGIIAYSLQLYFDFYGYSLIAIGLGHMLGFQIPDNFDHPYTTLTMTDFWRKWHMTLGAWFRDYVYIPLGGNRVRKGRHIFNLLVVWLLTGFWHGASWNFIFWGLFLFLCIVTEKNWTGKYFREHKTAGHVYMILLIPISWLMFAISDLEQLTTYAGRLIGIGGGDNVIAGIEKVSGYWEFLLIGILCCTNFPKIIYRKWKLAPVTSIVLLAVFWFAVYYMCMSSNDPFMYFRF